MANITLCGALFLSISVSLVLLLVIVLLLEDFLSAWCLTAHHIGISARRSTVPPRRRRRLQIIWQNSPFSQTLPDERSWYSCSTAVSRRCCGRVWCPCGASTEI